MTKPEQPDVSRAGGEHPPDLVGDLVGRDLRGRKLSGLSFRGRDLSGVILEGALLVGADLRDTGLVSANLSGAKLNSALLDGADLSDTAEAANLLLDRTVFNWVALDDDAEPVRAFWFELDSDVEAIVLRFRDQRAIRFDFHVLERFGGFVERLDLVNWVSLEADAVRCASKPEGYRE